MTPYSRRSLNGDDGSTNQLWRKERRRKERRRKKRRRNPHLTLRVPENSHDHTVEFEHHRFRQQRCVLSHLR
eukprot:CAMPEP_0183376744 /NCGR_PEP_ID=MMETSP0164_2-20130417/121157_1 /TAXON_ID=221442 /ORGANISM="Coccolithus pelagicus ssp braarudi, Strain PLY182g" /LENGTH=71 /DNA_ID=CAMNT_0025554105 /DNA_START=50 /DNA_END=262 /DNA_ORIENTATION=+